jgi:hypothetical protein
MAPSKKTTFNIILVLLVIALAFLLWKFLFSQPGKKPTQTAQLVPQAFLAVGSDAASANEFVQILLSVRNIRFSTELFQNPIWETLEDFSVELLPKEKGRVNPFAPIGSGVETNLSEQSTRRSE